MSFQYRNHIFLLCFTFLFFFACSESEPLKSSFKLVPSERSNINFENQLPTNLQLNIFNYMYYYNGGGTAVGDLNKDGLMDLVFSSNLGPEKIYINQGNMNFTDVSDISLVDGGPNSWTNGVALVDINNDGKLDIYLSQVGNYREINCTNKLFICSSIDEKGIPHYIEKSEEFGLDFKGFSTQAGFFDYDLDGDLDMYLMNHSLHHNGTFGQRKEFIDSYSEISGDKIYRNDDGQFIDVTKSTGIYSNVIGYGLGLAFGDVNNDDYPDIYIGNDFHENDYLYLNNQDGTFSEVINDQIKHTSRFSMGVDIADINNDEFQDIISLDMLPEDPYILKTSEGEDALDIFNFKLGYGYNHQYAKNALQLNQGNGTFKEIATYSGVHATDWSWTPLFFDFDMDGNKDLFITNGIPKRMNDIDYINFMSGNDIQYKIQFDQLEKQDLSALEKIPEIKLKNKFYKNTPTLEFEDLKNQIANHEKSYSNSAVYADLDNDGDYDIITNNINQKAFLYENLNEVNTVEIKLKGDSLNPFALGTRIKAYYNEICRDFNYSSTKGFQSSMINQILIPKQDLDSIIILWPDHKKSFAIYQQENEVFFDQVESTHKLFEHNPPAVLSTQDLTEKTGINFIHKENPFVEFNREPLIPFSTSAEGPALAVADINGDGLDDFFIGSSKRKRNAIYLQNKNGQFNKGSLQGLQSDSIYEEVDAIFSDIDNDGDPDLIVATGGNEYRLNSPYTQALLYRNIDGTLQRDLTAFENIHLNASCILAEDIDADGDIDLFIGGRAIPWKYGEIPSSYLLENDGKGNFTDITQKTFGKTELGIVKDAEWKDLNQNGRSELILALEWDGIVSYHWNEKKLIPNYLFEEKGLWNSITIADFNNDGLLDIFAGNLGLNSRLKASKLEPLKMYYNDFDDNGVKEQILTYFVGNKEIPFSNLMELQKQVPTLKKQFLYAKDFANSDIEKLFSNDKIKSAIIFEATQLKSTLLLNQSDGSFKPAKLPNEIQYTSYYSAKSHDFNNDGLNDILLGGNYHYANVQMGRYDADNGSVLLSNAQGEYELKNLINSPLIGQIKKIESINIGDQKAFIFAQNNEYLKLLSFE